MDEWYLNQYPDFNTTYIPYRDVTTFDEYNYARRSMNRSGRQYGGGAAAMMSHGYSNTTAANTLASAVAGLVTSVKDILSTSTAAESLKNKHSSSAAGVSLFESADLLLLFLFIVFIFFACSLMSAINNLTEQIKELKNNLAKT